MESDQLLTSTVVDTPMLERPPSLPVTVSTASIVAVAASPVDPNSIPIDPPHGSPPPPTGQLLPDVAAAEAQPSPMKIQTPPPSTPSPPPIVNNLLPHLDSGATDPLGLPFDPQEQSYVDPPVFDEDALYKTEPDADGDIVMNPDANGNGIHTGASPHVVYPHSPISFSYSHDDDGPPPAKRQKLDSPVPDPNNVAPHDLESPVALAPPVDPWARPMTQPQNKFAISVVRALKKNKDAIAFLNPVDPIALNIPHYHTIITSPMDLSTIEKKLGAIPKTDLELFPRYANVEEFVADVRLIFQNCLTFNGPDHLVTQMAKRLEEAFDKQLKNMPTADEIKLGPKIGPKKPGVARRPSMAGSSRRDDSYAIARPKREIPPPREYREQYVEPRRPPTKKRFPKRDDGTLEQLKFCQKLVTELFRPKYSSSAYPFYEPVDIVKLDIPHYPKIVKKPMDMSTIQMKLNNSEYADARGFYNDFKLMIKNCFAFNPAGTPVNQAGIELNEIFDEKWASLPSLYGESEDDGEEEESDMEHSNTVLMMEAQIQSLHSALAHLKKKPKKDKHRKQQPVWGNEYGYHSMPKPPKHFANGRSGGANAGFKKKKKPTHDEEETLSFEQKKQLSETIQTLDGGRLEKVLEIIDEVYPEIRETSEEIELDIDSLPPHVLMRLYNFVIRPNKPRVGRPPNGSASVKGSSSLAGTKRKSMNEDEESAKIRQLEETLTRLKNGSATAEDAAVAARATANGGLMASHVGGDQESGSDSDSTDSSGSDSE